MKKSYSDSQTLSIQLHKLGNMLDKAADMKLNSELGFSFSQFKILMAIEKNPIHSQNLIASYLGQTEAAVSRQINLLVKRKLLCRDPSCFNHRKQNLIITKSGKTLLCSAWQILDQLHQKFYKNLKADEVGLLVNSLSKIVLTVEQHFGIRNIGVKNG